ncbi:hypothetical protein JKP88DRAFT_315836 [Tribonema minus]|uniref:AAA+ ATPase domain-containing protein n=1 Tax=Tribonema minus TaxID=303371 RepID=A0A836CEU4_9STRA|nr:hypothetical protein JKP88DRAFT_315836 [Tribonema minus]
MPCLLLSPLALSVFSGAAQAGVGAGSGAGGASAAAAFGVPSEGISARRIITKREKTCNDLLELVMHQGYVLIKGPPQSGKTSLLQLLRGHLRERNQLVCAISCQGQERTFAVNDIIREKLGLPPNVDPIKHLMQGDKMTILLIDEAQLLYNMERSGSEQLWGVVKALQGGGALLEERPQLRIVLAAAYGTQRSAAAASPRSPTSTPVDISAGIGVGLLSYSLDYLVAELQNELQAPDRVNANAMYKLCSKSFFDGLSRVRSLMSYDDVVDKDGAIPLLRQLLWTDCVEVDLSAPSVQAQAALALHTCGLVALGHGLSDSCIHFTSPLHKLWITRKHYTQRCSGTSGGNMWDLIVRMLERMDRNVLINTRSLTKSNQPLERCWQAEVYRTLMCSLPADIVPSPEVGPAFGITGYVDFYVPAPYCAALELTRDGQLVEGHLARFQDPLKYKPLIDCGMVTQYAVVDIRSPGSQPDMSAVTGSEHLFTVLMDDGYESATIYHNGRPPQTIRVAGSSTSESEAALRAATQGTVQAHN